MFFKFWFILRREVFQRSFTMTDLHIKIGENYGFSMGYDRPVKKHDKEFHIRKGWDS